MGRVFLLSPASLVGVRGRRIVAGESSSPVLGPLLEGSSLPLGRVYAAISSLYFRGKLEYARRFGRRPDGRSAVLVITPDRGLVDVDTPVTLEELRRFSTTAIDADEPRYVEALLSSAREASRSLDGCEVVLLGSIATSKYVEPLLGVFAARLLVPEAFIGRGDMSRGGLLLRAAAEGRELDYVAVASATRRGSRPPRLDPAGRARSLGSGA